MAEKRGIGSSRSAVLAARLGAVLLGFGPCAAWAGAGLAASQPDKASTGSSATVVPGVTVVAPKSPQATPVPLPVIQNFVRSHGATTRIGQLAKWHDDVCPTTIGLPPAFNAFVSQRVTEVAANVGAPVKADGRCTTNIAIIFSPEPQKLLDHIRQKHWVLLGFHYPAQLKRIATFNHPIQAWYATGTEGSGGNIAVPGSGGGLALDDSCCATPGGVAGSHFSVGLNSQFLSVVIVADANKVADYKIGAIADYVALLALTHANSLDACGEMASIIDLMSPTCAAASKPDAMTDGDIAYLKALYATNLSNVLWVEQDSIADRMQQGLGSK